MREIGVRKLKATLSRVLREPPHRYSEEMRKLIAEGRVTPASRPLPLPKAPPPIKTGVSASAIVLAEREEDR